MDDYFRPVPGYKGYSASLRGFIINESTGKVLTASISRSGRAYVRICRTDKDGKKIAHRRRLSKLIRETYPGLTWRCY